MGAMFSSHPSAGFTQAELIENIHRNKYKHIIIMCGAGISTNAGIPDFRTPSAGMYMNLRKYNLPYPEAVFTGSYFKTDPKPFYGLVRDIYPEKLAPTVTHKFFTLLHQKGLLQRVYTQNIDALEHLAGLPEDKVVEAHGSFKTSYCCKCKKTYDLHWFKTELFSPMTNDEVPKCSCGGVVRPDVTLFGEALPDRYWTHLNTDFAACDLLLVIGTSLAVSPFNSLVGETAGSVPRVYVNKTKPGSNGMIGWMLGMVANVDFSRESDLIMLEDCDSCVTRICRSVGWEEDLNRIEIQTLESLE